MLHQMAESSFHFFHFLNIPSPILCSLELRKKNAGISGAIGSILTFAFGATGSNLTEGCGFFKAWNTH